MRTQEEVNQAIRIMDQHPDLKAIITPGVDIRTVLSRNQIRSLNQESFRALCSLPLDFIIPPGRAEEMFISQSVRYGVKWIYDKQTGKMKVYEKAKTI